VWPDNFNRVAADEIFVWHSAIEVFSDGATGRGCFVLINSYSSYKNRHQKKAMGQHHPVGLGLLVSI
jgi:hypothetical protein